MKKIASVAALDDFGRTRLSESFFMRDFLYSEIASFHGLPNIPGDPELAIQAGTNLCNNLLEPLKKTFGHLAIRSAFRSEEVNGFGNKMQREGKSGYSCAANEKNFADHIWDKRNAAGHMGATACVVIPWFADKYDAGADWRSLAWWIHDHLPYSRLYFFPKRAAFNINWCEVPERRIDSYITPRGCLTRPGMENHEGSHSELYPGFPALVTR